MSGALPSSASFFDELRHRKVYRTGAAYLTAVFVVWQAGDIAIPALGLPPSMMTFLVIVAIVGFPLAVALSWAFEVVPQRPLASRRLPLRLLRRRPGLVASGLVLVTAVLSWSLIPRTAVALTEGEWVLLADLQNETGDSIFDGALTEALRVALAGSPHVNLVPRQRVRESLQRMRRPPDSRLDEATALEVALREGVALVLLPSIHRVGASYQLVAHGVDPETGETLLSRSRNARNDEEILPALDELARHVRQDLGESLVSMVRRRVHLDQATTGSLEALKAWTEANRLFDEGRSDEAGTLYERAVELDSTFALARADLGQWYHWNRNDPEIGNRHFDAALRHLDGLAERERQVIQGKAAEWRGDRETAIQHYLAATVVWPEDEASWGNLAYQFMRLGRYEEAIRAYEKVLSIDSLDANAWVNLASVHVGNDQRNQAIPLYEKAFRIAPALRTDAVVNEEYGHTLLALGRAEEAEAVYALMLDGTPDDRARGLRSMALLRTFQGRFDAGAELLRQAIVIHEAAGVRVSEYRDRCFLASAYLRGAHAAEAGRELATARGLAIGNTLAPGWAEIAGVLAARAGDVAAAAALFDTAVARGKGIPAAQPTILHLRGEVALAAGDVPAAIEALQEVVARWPESVPRAYYALGKAHLAAGEPREARATWRELLAVSSTPPAREAQEDWILTLYHLGRVEEDLGRPEEARTLYHRFLGYWGAGDRGVAEVEDARRRLDGLNGVG